MSPTTSPRKCVNIGPDVDAGAGAVCDASALATPNREGAGKMSEGSVCSDCAEAAATETAEVSEKTTDHAANRLSISDSISSLAVRKLRRHGLFAFAGFPASLNAPKPTRRPTLSNPTVCHPLAVRRK